MEHDETNVAAARAAHEANRVLCAAIGQSDYGPWDECDEGIQASVLAGVEAVKQNPARTPRESHESWCQFKLAKGWKLGPEKSLLRKEHPNLVPYEKLPIAEQSKDAIFLAVVRAVLSARGALIRLDEGAEFEFFEGRAEQLPPGGGWGVVSLTPSPNSFRWRRLAR